ncbi:histidine phosphotransferase [Jannaschia sp. Os4]|uniref:histidine phosphotransferase family protein n=1 Tax=Jannaschia sp. Os4 TaxID=2807617 RepID=UPI0019392B94|nr:histidine phosphotransferase family protein [Jannaschia sp. Os4]MBM2576607.1 histidine phosphotransferase [Jannaschia sp. Os4]
MPKDSLPPAEGDPVDLAPLVGSRLCHDLVSPLGAVANGIELLELAGHRGEEIALIRGAMYAALARLRFFRLAFGAAAPDQTVPAREMRAMAAGLDGRATVTWSETADWPRPATRLACLGLACLEAAVPWGGAIDVTSEADGFVLTATAERLRIDDALWDALAEGRVPPGSSGADVQFGLLVQAAIALGRTIRVDRAAGGLTLRV